MSKLHTAVHVWQVTFFETLEGRTILHSRPENEQWTLCCLDSYTSFWSNRCKVNVFLITCNHVICACIDLEFLTAIKHRFSRKPMEGCVSDVYDGEVYKKYADFFSGENNISLLMNFDGAPKFKSPIQFIINELPPSKRYGNIFTQSC